MVEQDLNPPQDGDNADDTMRGYGKEVTESLNSPLPLTPLGQSRVMWPHQLQGSLGSVIWLDCHRPDLNSGSFNASVDAGGVGIIWRGGRHFPPPRGREDRAGEERKAFGISIRTEHLSSHWHLFSKS